MAKRAMFRWREGFGTQGLVRKEGKQVSFRILVGISDVLVKMRLEVIFVDCTLFCHVLSRLFGAAPGRRPWINGS